MIKNSLLLKKKKKISSKLLENLKSRLMEVRQSRKEDREDLIMLSDDHCRDSKVKNEMRSLERKIHRYLLNPNCMAQGFYRMKLWTVSHTWQFTEKMQKESAFYYKASKKTYVKLIHEEVDLLKEIKIEEERIYREDIDLNYLFSDMIDSESVVQIIDNLVQVISSNGTLVPFYFLFLEPHDGKILSKKSKKL